MGWVAAGVALDGRVPRGESGRVGMGRDEEVIAAVWGEAYHQRVVTPTGKV